MDPGTLLTLVYAGLLLFFALNLDYKCRKLMNMRTSKKNKKRSPRATDGGSAVALAARIGRPGGIHRTTQPRTVAKRRAIYDQEA